MSEIHQVIVDGYELHAPLEGRSLDVTLCGRTALMEETQVETFSFTVHRKLKVTMWE